MEQSEMMSGQAKEALAGQVHESLGMNEQSAEVEGETPTEHNPMDDLPKAAKERLGRQDKRHAKELRALQSQISELHNRLGSQAMNSEQQPSNNYTPQPMSEGGNIEDHIHRAVNAALQAKDQREQAAKDAESQRHVQSKYQALNDHLDKASSKYEDFDEVVRSHDAPFTTTMRDTALLLPNSADVLYKLGKNTPELHRIAALHPIDQAKEMLGLSIALHGGTKDHGTSAPRQLGDVKSNPVNAGSVNENTSVGELRRKLKANWK